MNLRLARHFVVVFIAALPSLLDAQAPARPVLTLDQAVGIAASSNPLVEAAHASESEAEAGVASARAPLFPKIGASETFTESTDPVFAFGARLRQGRFTSSDFSPAFLNSPGPTGDFTSTAGVAWTAFDAGVSKHQLRAARRFLSAAEQQTYGTQQSIAFATIRAYYRALLADDEKITTAAAVERAHAFAKEAHDRVDTGLALVADGMQADVEVSTQEEERTQAESNATLAYAELGGFLGDPTRQLTLARPAGTPEQTLVDLPRLQKQALAARQDLLALHSRIAGMEEQVKAGHASYGPQVSAFGNVEADNPHPLSGGATNWTLGAKVELQVFDGGARHAQIAKAVAQKQAAQAAYKQAETQAILDVQRAFYACQTAQRQFGIAGAMLNNAEETLRTAQDRYAAGLVTVSEVLRQQEQLHDIELNRTRAIHEWWIASAQLRFATGDLHVPDTGVKP